MITISHGELTGAQMAHYCSSPSNLSIWRISGNLMSRVSRTGSGVNGVNALSSSMVNFTVQEMKYVFLPVH